jgi:hypothetical protein
LTLFDDEGAPLPRTPDDALERLRYLTMTWQTRGWKPEQQAEAAELFNWLDDYLSDGGYLPAAWDSYQRVGDTIVQLRGMDTLHLPGTAESGGTAPVGPPHPSTPRPG